MKKHIRLLLLSLSMLLLSSCTLVILPANSDQIHHSEQNTAPSTTPIGKDNEAFTGPKAAQDSDGLLPAIRFTDEQINALRTIKWRNEMGVADKESNADVFSIAFCPDPAPEMLPQELIDTVFSGWNVNIDLRNNPGLIKDTELYPNASGDDVYAFFLLRLPCGGLKFDGPCGIGMSGTAACPHFGTTSDRNQMTGETVLLVRLRIRAEEIRSRVATVRLTIDPPDFL